MTTDKTAEVPMTRGVLSEIVSAARDGYFVRGVERRDDEYVVYYAELRGTEEITVFYGADGSTLAQTMRNFYAAFADGHCTVVFGFDIDAREATKTGRTESVRRVTYRLATQDDLHAYMQSGGAIRRVSEPLDEAVIDIGGPKPSRYWRVTSDHPPAHPDAHAAAVHARLTGSVGCTYNDVTVKRVDQP